MEKGYLHNIVRYLFSNLRQTCTPSWEERNERPAILPKLVRGWQKLRTKMRTDKMYRKMHHKIEYFHQMFPHPEILVCVFCRKNSKCDRKTASKKFSQKIHDDAKQNPVCGCGRAGSLSICPFEKQKTIQKNRKIPQLAVLHLSAYQRFGAQFVTNSRNAPLVNAPFSKFQRSGKLLLTKPLCLVRAHQGLRILIVQ